MDLSTRERCSMGCPQCQRQNGPGAKFCDECGCVLPWLWPRAAIGSDRVGRPRHKPPPARRREIAAAIGVVATGLGVISGVVIASPGWQRMIAAWGAALANADAYAPDSAEHAYWRSVAIAIRDEGHRSRK